MDNSEPFVGRKCWPIAVATALACAALRFGFGSWGSETVRRLAEAPAPAAPARAAAATAFVSLGRGTVCRAGAKDTDIVPHHGRIQSGVSRRDCEERCRQQDTCHGFEFRSSERRCELWLQDIAAHVHDFYHRTVPGSPDFECIVKSPSCSELKAHKALHDAAASELSFFLEDYCEYGPTDEAFDVCSRSYDARRRRKCAGDEPPTLCGSHQEM
ncbi:unnamed protein product [Effrenium voratum]|nr:unnamed protein product [Effrenium voratum]